MSVSSGVPCEVGADDGACELLPINRADGTKEGKSDGNEVGLTEFAVGPVEGCNDDAMVEATGESVGTFVDEGDAERSHVSGLHAPQASG